MSDFINESTIVLVGQAGNGKSSTGNTLLGRREFTSNIVLSARDFRSEIDIARSSRTIGDRYYELEVVDTPGLFMSNNVAETALKLLQVTYLKPHVFVLVLRANRFTDNERYTANLLRIIFGNHIFKRTLIVITYGDQFESEQHLVTFMKTSDDVKKLLVLCEHRVMAIDNVRKEVDFIKFCRFTDKISTEHGRMIYNRSHAEILKSVLQNYHPKNRADNSIATQLTEISEELGRRMPNWKMPLFVDESRKSGTESKPLLSNVHMNLNRECKIVLVGKTGNGKSATGNTLLGWDSFKSIVSAKGVTNYIQSARCTTKIGDSQRVMEIIDTPGLFDCGKVAETSLKLLDVVHLRPNVFVLVLKAGRFTEEEKYTVDMLRIIFGDHIFRHTVIVITHGSEFQHEEDFAAFLSESEHVNKLIGLCGQRVLKIDNKTRDFDIVKFFKFADQITQNGRLLYIHENGEEHKAVLQNYLRSNNGEKSIAIQLQEMSKELGRRLPNWKVPLIAGALAGAAMTGGGVLVLGAFGSTTAAAAGSGVLASSLGSAAAYAGSMAAAGGAMAMQGATVVGAGVLTLGRVLGPLVLRKFW